MLYFYFLSQALSQPEGFIVPKLSADEYDEWLEFAAGSSHKEASRIQLYSYDDDGALLPAELFLPVIPPIENKMEMSLVVIFF